MPSFNKLYSSEEPLPDGPNKSGAVPVDVLLAKGYRAIGWDKGIGLPVKEMVEEPDLK